MNVGAVMDPTDTYRYSLWRIWNADLPTVLFIMLNPSTADANKDDPTIRRCIGFAKAWGFGALEVRNLFAYRATDPDELKRCADPIGPDNDKHILEGARIADKIVLAWGTKGSLLGRGQAVYQMIAKYEPECLAISADGHPKHPLYIRADQPAIVYSRGG
ncbi:DUF1643 domain-containing protein [Cohnella boryungensis]|uniref:DUF1643 domain-containing protein n=1 Tax=Cohnella boryungensis TaxID=768479 RepID=A0ABV8SFZ6_9BACL